MLEAITARLPFTPKPPLVSVVRLHGVIGQAGRFGSGLSLTGVAGLLERAFAPAKQAAVALVVNSPGGSPVQSSLIARRIRDLAAEKKVPVIAFTEDVAASGGYWLACAADEIWADESSLIGSIGVLFSGFGFHDFIQRHGVERRLFTSGERKAMLDPFLPQREEDVAHLRAIQDDIHEAFKAMVRDRRAGRLKGDENVLFSGEFWAGRKALGFGLVDGIGDPRTVLRRRFGDKVRLRLVEGQRGWLRRRLRMTARPAGHGLAGEAAGAVLTALEERALWGRFGL